MSAIGAVGAVGGAVPVPQPALLSFASPTQLDALARLVATRGVTAEQLALAMGIEVAQVAGQVEVQLAALRRLLMSAGFKIPPPTTVDGDVATPFGESGEGTASKAGPQGGAGAAGGGVARAGGAGGAVGGAGGPAGQAGGGGLAGGVAPASASSVGAAAASAAGVGPAIPTATHVPTAPLVAGAPLTPLTPPVAGATDAVDVAGAQAGSTFGGGTAGQAAQVAGGVPGVPTPRDVYSRGATVGARPDAPSAPVAPPPLHTHGALRIGGGEPAVVVLVDESSPKGLAAPLLAAGTPRGAVVVTSLGPDGSLVTASTAGTAPPAPATAGQVAGAAASGGTPDASGTLAASGPAGAAGRAGGAATGAAGSGGTTTGATGATPGAQAPQVPAAHLSPPPVSLATVRADPISGLRSWALVDMAVPPVPAAQVDAVARAAAPPVPPVVLGVTPGEAEVRVADVLARAGNGAVDVVADARTAAAAIDLAMRDPQRVRRLVIDLSAFFAGGVAAKGWLPDEVAAAGAVRPTDPGRLAEMLAASGTWGAPKEERRRRKPTVGEGGRRNLAEHLFAALFSIRVADELDEVEVPITIITPEDEAVRTLVERAAQFLDEAKVIASNRPEVVVLEIIREG